MALYNENIERLQFWYEYFKIKIELVLNEYSKFNLENGSFLNSDNFDATDLRF